MTNTLIAGEVVRAHTHGSIHLNTAGAEPVYHCDHANGEISIRASRVYGSVDVYIGGTRADIVAWAAGLVTAALASPDGE